MTNDELEQAVVRLAERQEALERVLVNAGVVTAAAINAEYQAVQARDNPAPPAPVIPPAPPAAAHAQPPLSEAQIMHMVDRFLGWRLPEPWHPDNGISYQRPNYAHAPADHDWPTGTNLFDATQATAMVRYMLEGMPE